MLQEDQLYVLDVYLNKITFAPSMIDIPHKEELEIFVSFSDYVNMDIKAENSIRSTFTNDIHLSKDDLNLHLGKSQVFFGNAEHLKIVLQESPLKLLLTTQWNGEVFWEVNFSWTSDFISMVDRSKRLSDKVMPASIERIQDLCNMSGQVVGQLDMFIRLSCFGHMTFEQFKKIPRQTIALQPPIELKNFLQPSEAAALMVTFFVGILSFILFITAIYLTAK